MEKPIIFFDMDEVLCNIRVNMQAALNSETGVNLSWRDWHTYSLETLYGLPIKVCLDILLKHGVLESATLEPGVHKAFQTARVHGFQVGIMTARGWHPKGAALTKAWLTDNHLIPDVLEVVPFGESKGSHITRYPNVALFIDDHADHVRDVIQSQHVPEVVLLNRPWNKTASELRRVDSLHEFNEIIAAARGRMSA